MRSGYGRVDAWIGASLERVVGASQRRPVRVVLLATLATIAALVYCATHLGVHGGTEALFDAELPFRQVERRYYEAFPTLYETMFVVVDAPTPERAGQAALALAEALHGDAEYFQRVYLPGGGDFFETHAFLYLSTEELQDLADRLAQVQPYLAELSRDGTIRGLASLLGRGSRAVREGDVSDEQLGAMFERFSSAVDATAEGRSHPISWAEVLAGRGFDVDLQQRFLLIQPVLDWSSLQPAKRAIQRVRDVAERLGLGAGSGVRVRITGDVALSAEELEVVQEQAAEAGIASLILVGAILAFGLRSFRQVIATLVTLVVGLVLTAGLAAVVIGHLNMISVCFAVLFIGLGVDFGIHFCTRYSELRSGGRPHAEALGETAADVGSSIALCAVTTAIGFFAFVPTDFAGVAELGLISGAGMFVSLACTVVLLPALLSLPPLPRPAGGGLRGSRSLDGLELLPVRRARLVRAVAIALGAAALLLVPRARFDNNPLNVRDPSSESVRTFAELLERGGSSPWSLNAVADDFASAEALAERLRALDEVERVVTVADFIPTEQEEKLGIIEDVAMFLPSLPDEQGRPARPTLAESIDALEALGGELRRLLMEMPQGVLAVPARRLRSSLERYLAVLRDAEDPSGSLDALTESALGSLAEQLRTLEAALSAGTVTLENLPDALLETLIAADGRVRVQIFPKADLTDHEALVAFVDAVRDVEPRVAGSAQEIIECGRAVVRAFQQALVAASVAITLILLLLWGSVKDAALVLAPLSLAAALTVAAAVLLDIPFNFADVIVLPLLLGIGVDSGIHLVHRARFAPAGETNVLHSSTARAVVYSALTTIGSFGTMGFATHLGLATLGRLLSLGVGITMLCNLILLPALIALRAPASGERTSGAIPTPPVRSH